MGALHSRWSASGASRWINCAGSLNAVAALPVELREKRSSVYAEEGTAAHFVADQCLEHGVSADHYEDYVVRVSGQGTFFDEEAKRLGPDDDLPDGCYRVGQEMVEGVQAYIDVLATDLEEMGSNAELVKETRADLSWLRPGLFGTRDARIAVPFGLLRVYDFKFGRGVVEVNDNSQLKFYALDDVRKGDYEEVELVIVQPRAYHGEGIVRRWKTTPAELEEFANLLGSSYDATLDPDAERVAGEWCLFCPAASLCPEHTRRATQEAIDDFDDYEPDAPASGRKATPGEIEHLRRAFALIPEMDAFAKGVMVAVERLLQSGVKLDFAKLVRGKANRAWTVDEAGLLAEVKKEKIGVKTEVLYAPRKIKSPAQMEKVAGMKPIVGRLAARPQGKTTVATMDDPRDAIEVNPGDDFRE